MGVLSLYLNENSHNSHHNNVGTVVDDSVVGELSALAPAITFFVVPSWGLAEATTTLCELAEGDLLEDLRILSHNPISKAPASSLTIQRARS